MQVWHEIMYLYPICNGCEILTWERVVSSHNYCECHYLLMVKLIR